MQEHRMTRLAELIDEYNRIRREAGEPVMTQRRLAELAGVAEASVSRHANAVTTMSLPQAVAYARALKCRVDDLMADPKEAVNKRAASLKKRGAA